MAWIIEESAVLGGADNCIQVKDEGSGLYIAEVYDARDAALIAAAPELAEALDNVTAALENCLATFGKYMSDGDRIGRGNVAREARALADRILRPEPEEDPEAEERKAARREREKREEARDYHDNVKTREFVGED
jgi:hypothetical protein